MNRLERTRRLLDTLQAKQEQLSRDMDRDGVVGFLDRMDWLIEHAPEDEKLAWSRRWKALGITDPVQPDKPVKRIHGDDHGMNLVKPCIRCGVPRVVRLGRGSGLCADCRFVMSREEIALWAGEKKTA